MRPSGDLMDRLFGDDQCRAPLVINPFAAAVLFGCAPLPIEDFHRKPKPRKVSAGELAKRAQQKAQRNARKIARKASRK